MSSEAVRDHIESRTGQAFGQHIWHHLFRDCAVSDLIECVAEEIGIARDLLGHNDLKMLRKHYIQDREMTAPVRIQEMIAARRRAAASRDTVDST